MRVHISSQRTQCPRRFLTGIHFPTGSKLAKQVQFQTHSNVVRSCGRLQKKRASDKLKAELGRIFHRRGLPRKTAAAATAATAAAIAGVVIEHAHS